MKEILFGHMTATSFIGCLLMSFVGAFANMLVDVVTRNPMTDKSPVTFDPNYFVKDNSKRIILLVLMVLIWVRFSLEISGLIGVFFPTISEWINANHQSPFIYLLIGGMFDYLVAKLKRYKRNLKVK